MPFKDTIKYPIGNYHYKVMRFGLKNAGSTYQRMMTRMFELQMGKNIEVYIDDMVVKSKLVSEHVRDLGDIFEILRRHRLRLNASKCSFEVGLGKFLGYMVTHRGIDVSPDQIRAIHSMQPPRNPKEVQKLTDMIATLNHFISRSADRCRPFFLLLNKWKGSNGLKNAPWPSNSSKSICLSHQSCLAPKPMKFCSLTLSWPFMQ